MPPLTLVRSAGQNCYEETAYNFTWTELTERQPLQLYTLISTLNSHDGFTPKYLL